LFQGNAVVLDHGESPVAFGVVEIFLTPTAHFYRADGGILILIGPRSKGEMKRIFTFYFLHPGESDRGKSSWYLKSNAGNCLGANEQAWHSDLAILKTQHAESVSPLPVW
jgi:hypothetical protein